MDLRAPTDEETAFHEAGHVLIAHYATPYLRVQDVSLDVEGETYGSTGIHRPLQNNAIEAMRAIFEECVMAAAGCAAQIRYLGEKGVQIDDKIIAALCAGAKGDCETIRERFGKGVWNDFIAVARDRLSDDDRWQRLTRLAKTLLDRRKLNGFEITQAIESDLT